MSQSWGQLPDPYGQQGNRQPTWSPPPQKKSSVPLILGILGGGSLLVVLLCCGCIASLFTAPSVSASAKEPFHLASVPVPPLPDRAPFRPFDGQVNVLETTILGQTGGKYSPPGHGGKLYVYFPVGEHPPGTLPCVLICGAGSTLLEGMDLAPLDGQGDSTEHLPYARNGIAVVAYELDGYNPSHDGMPNKQDYEAFKAACAGMVNARNAFEFILAKLPEVNPSQIFTAGHSSAGTAALLFAAHEPRVAGCMAYAPCSDVVDFIPPIQARLLSGELPGLPAFLHQSSPLTHISRIRCPTLLFHAEDDSVVEVAKSRSFADQLKAQGTDVKLITVPSGDHYEPMISQGIPAGIQWIKQRTGKL